MVVNDAAQSFLELSSSRCKLELEPRSEVCEEPADRVPMKRRFVGGLRARVRANRRPGKIRRGGKAQTETGNKREYGR